MREYPTATIPDDTAGITILPPHQMLAAELVEGQIVGANAMADVIALLDSLRQRPDSEIPVLRIGGLAEISSMLHGRHGGRTLQRLLRLLMQAGIVDRRLPLDSPRPAFVLNVPALAERLDRVVHERSARASSAT